MSFAVTQLNQLLQSLCNQHWCFYRTYWVSKIYEQWLNTRQPESNRLILECELVNNTTWKFRVHRIPKIPRWRIISAKATIKRVQKLQILGQTPGLWPSVRLTHDPTRPDPAKIIDPVTYDPKTRLEHCLANPSIRTWITMPNWIVVGQTIRGYRPMYWVPPEKKLGSSRATFQGHWKSSQLT